MLDFEAGALLKFGYSTLLHRRALGCDRHRKAVSSPKLPSGNFLSRRQRHIGHMSMATLRHHREVIRQSLARRPKILIGPIAPSEYRSWFRNSRFDRRPRSARTTMDSRAPPSFVENDPPLIEQIGLHSGISDLYILGGCRPLLSRDNAQAFGGVPHHPGRIQVDSNPLGIGNGCGSLMYGSLILGTILGILLFRPFPKTFTANNRRADAQQNGT